MDDLQSNFHTSWQKYQKAGRLEVREESHLARRTVSCSKAGIATTRQAALAVACAVRSRASGPRLALNSCAWRLSARMRFREVSCCCRAAGTASEELYSPTEYAAESSTYLTHMIRIY